MKKIIALFLAACVLAGVVFLRVRGRGSDAGGQSGPAVLSGEVTYGWSLQYIPLPEPLVGSRWDFLSSVHYADGEYIYLGGSDSSGRPVLGRFDGEDFTEYPLPAEVGCVYQICSKDGGIAVLAGDAIDFENQPSSVRAWLLTYDSAGVLLQQTPLGFRFGADGMDLYFVSGMAYVDGYYYFINNRNLWQADEGGALFNSLHGDTSRGDMAGSGYYFRALAAGPDGLVVLGTFHDESNFLAIRRLTDPEAMRFQTLFDNENVTEDSDYIHGFGYGPEGELLLCKGSTIVTAATGEVLYDYDWDRYDGNDCSVLYPWSGGWLLSDRGERITALSYGERLEKTELIVWNASQSFLPYSNLFNQSNREYTLHVMDMRNLTAEEAARLIASGQGPDLYLIDGNGDFLGFSPGAIFEDLDPWLEQSGYSRDIFVPQVLAAMNPAEELYTMPMTFGIFCFPLNTSLLPREGESFAAAYALPGVQREEISVLPTRDPMTGYDYFTSGYTRSALFHYLANVYLGDHLQEDAGLCDFDSPDYITLLESCAAVRPSYAPEGVPCIYDDVPIDRLTKLSLLHERHCRDYSLVNAMGSAFYLPAALAIASGSEHKEGVWAYIEFLLADTGMEELEMNFSALPAIEKKLDDLLTYSLSGGSHMAAFCDYDAEQFQYLLENTRAVMDQYPEILQIMTEEAEKFFAGDRTAEETARMTQSRASLYVSEHFG